MLDSSYAAPKDMMEHVPPNAGVLVAVERLPPKQMVGYVVIGRENADVVPTLARVMGISLEPKGSLRGRVLEETLTNGSDAPAVEQKRATSPVGGKMQTILLYQEFGGERYLDAARMIMSEARADEANCPH